MIYIKELCPPVKLSGRSSLKVTFDYNIELVDKIKQYYPAI